MNDNKLIAEFMGALGTPKYSPTEWDVYITGCLDVDSDNENAKHFYTPNEMKYHTSWDWLMPVIEECKATNVHPKMPTIMQSTLTLILDEIDALMIGHWGIEMTYKEVVKFITKYNEYKTHTT